MLNLVTVAVPGEEGLAELVGLADQSQERRGQTRDIYAPRSGEGPRCGAVGGLATGI